MPTLSSMIGKTPYPLRPRVMAVDDAPELLRVLEQVLEQHGCDVDVVRSGTAALHQASLNRPDLILLDVMMPDLDGFKVCRLFKQHPDLADVPVIFLSGKLDTESKLQAFRVGAVDYITKPFHPEELHARVRTHLRLRSLQVSLDYQRLVEAKVRELSEAQQATIFAMAKLAEQRDEDTGLHLERVREYCRLLAERLAEDSPYSSHITPEFITCIQHAAPLHDIGKVAIPDSVLLKPGKLTTEEFEVMKSHTIIGAENMQVVYNNYAGNPFIGMGIEIALYHHERWDGSGYPDGLVGRNIPLSARIMAVADCYDALCSDRCYRKALDHETAKSIILSEVGTHFDPAICDAFIALENQFSHIIKLHE